jgi:rubrerythrin
MSLKGSKTEQNLKDAFAGESQANRRYLYFAAKADVEGYNDVAAVFRSTAEGETGHAHGHLEYLEEVGDPATGMPIGSTAENLASAIAGETHEYTDMYPGMAKAARDEDFDEIADWFETLAKAERSHANRFQKALDTRSTGSPTNFMKKNPCSRNSNGYSTFATVAGAVSTCAIPSRLCSTRSTNRRAWSSTPCRSRSTGTSSITVTCVTCAT